MRHAARLFVYEFHDLIRSRWLLATFAVLLVITELLFRFGGEPSKVVISLMNVVLIVVPLFASVMGTIYVYNGREFNELLLAQPINRASIYSGKLGAFSAALALAFLGGMSIPFLVHSYGFAAHATRIAMLLAVGVALIVVFTGLAFFAATRFDDRIKGLGLVILTWFVLGVLYDGAILLLVYIFQDYPYEPGLVAMIFLNPIDLGRILVLLQLDIAALMGYTGAVFRGVFGEGHGVMLAALAMLVYAAVPAWFGLRTFTRKDF